MEIKEYLGIASGFALVLFITIMAKPITYTLTNINILEIINIIKSFTVIGGALMFCTGCFMLMIADRQHQSSKIGRCLFILGVLMFIIFLIGWVVPSVIFGCTKIL
ncbi:hypothetical protein [Clostridium botulinum]|uniref:Uncharacterized protein n=1 Tax=Clostridium botulinum TaxID=1491 RepID=A0A077K0B1_CLOBO|nr:hypothetical protein [Clostridium botulinum]BAP25641.1 hypothetical protein [Clostridium botulinum]